MKKIPNKKMAQIDSMYEIEKVLKNTQYKISEVLTPDGNNILHYLMLKENKNVRIVTPEVFMQLINKNIKR